MRILRRILIILGVAFAVVVIGGYWIAPMALSIYAARSAPSVARQVPRELKDFSISHATGRSLSYFGYEFDVPWEDADDVQAQLYPKENPSRVVLTFRSGLSVSFTALPAKEFINGLASSLHSSPQRVETAFGHEAAGSDYAFLKNLYEFTPDKMRFWAAPSVHYRDNFLLLIKSMSLSSSAQEGIFNIHSQGYKGFQQGDPDTHRSSIVVDLYSDDGGVEFIFAQQRYKGAVGVTQPEINRIVQSLHKLPNAELQKNWR